MPTESAMNVLAQSGKVLVLVPPQPRIQKSNPDIMNARGHMQSRVYDFLMQRHPKTHEVQPKRPHDLARRLDEGLCRFATSQEYLIYDTLERHLQQLLRQPAMNNNTNQQ